MKILHVAQALSRNFGGVQSVLHDLVNVQCKTGMEVDVLSTNADAPKGILPVIPNKFIENNGARLRYCSTDFRPLLFSLDFKQYIDRYIEDYDIIHIHGLYRFPPTYTAYQARRRGLPYIIQPHGMLDPYLYNKSTVGSVKLKRLYERWFDLPNLHSAGAIQYTAEEERSRASFLGIQAPTYVVPNGLDWEHYEKLPQRGAFRAAKGYGDESIVLFLGRLHLKKGLDLLIPAFDNISKKNPGAKLIIAGPDNDRYGQNVRKWVNERGLNGVVHFVGLLERKDVIQAYVDADVFVLPSYTENFGMTVVEAMACGLAVVISDQVNIHREVAQSGSGVVTRCDVDEVANVINVLLNDSAQREAMGIAGRHSARTLYSWTSIIQALIREYEAVIERSCKEKIF